jgi:hypothetical protein
VFVLVVCRLTRLLATFFIQSTACQGSARHTLLNRLSLLLDIL